MNTPPPLPFQAENIWRAFIELSAARQSGFSVQPIPYSEIAAYQTVTGRMLTGWEADQIRVIDDLYMKTVLDNSKKGVAP